MSTKKEIVRYLDEIQSIVDVCGEIKELSSKEDSENASLALAIMKAPTIPHFHKVATEFYFVLEGKGKLTVGPTTYEMRDGMLVIIPPNTAHYTIPRKVTKVLAFSAPAWSKEDQIIVEDVDEEEMFVVNYSLFQERSNLIDEFLQQIGLEFQEGMSQEEREGLDVKRQTLALKGGWNRIPISELRELLEIS